MDRERIEKAQAMREARDTARVSAGGESRVQAALRRYLGAEREHELHALESDDQQTAGQDEK